MNNFLNPDTNWGFGLDGVAIEGARIVAFLPRITSSFNKLSIKDNMYTVTIEVTQYGDPLTALERLNLDGWTYTAPTASSTVGSLVYTGARFPNEIELVNALHAALKNL